MSRAALLLMAAPSLLAACIAVDAPLPASVYYLGGPAEEEQVWRLEADGTTVVQITHEEGGVDDFAVSRSDGSLAFVRDNQLFLQDGHGENRRLIADDSQVDKLAEDYAFRGFVGSPVFSPNGRTLAYAFDGLHLYDLASGEDAHVLTNLGNLLGAPFVFDKEVYSPGSWSPDGTMLLVEMAYFEGSTLAVMEPGAQPPFRRLWSEGPACCMFNWTADGRSVLVANPFFTTNRPGLWRYDPDTGEETTLVPGVAEDGSLNYVGWPHQPLSGGLLYFFGNFVRFSPEVGIPLEMVRSDPDGANRMQVRQEGFRIIEALWAQDGSLALILRRSGEVGRQVVLARTDKSPLQVMIEENRIRRLTWGP